MEAFKITSKGQVTIPKEVREFLGISKGDRIMFIRKGEDIFIRKVLPHTLERLLTLTTDAIGNPEISEEEIMQQIKEVRKEIMADEGHYPRQF
jgi:AbrB family looped-hinge helix DNA binding protein